MAIKPNRPQNNATASPRPSLESTRTAPELRHPSPPPSRVLSSRFSSESLRASPMTWLSTAKGRIMHNKTSSISSPSTPAVIEISNPVLVVPVSPRVSTSSTVERRNESLGRGARPMERVEDVSIVKADSDMETLATPSAPTGPPPRPPRMRPRSQSMTLPHRPERSLPPTPAMALSASTSAIPSPTAARPPSFLLPDEPSSPVDPIYAPVIKAFKAAKLGGSNRNGQSERRASPTSTESPIMAGFAKAPRSSGQASSYPPTPSSAVGPPPSSSPSAFRALLTAPAPHWPAALADEAKRVQLDVGGHLFTTSLSTLTSRSPRLSDFAKHVLSPSQPQRKDTKVWSVASPARAPQIIDAPLAPPRSARADIISFPSPAAGIENGEEGGSDDWSRDYLLGATATETSTAEMRFRRVRTPSLSSSTSSTEETKDEEVVADPFAVLALFIDRDPAPFTAVMHYLRTSELLSPRCGLVLEDVEKEARWLGLDALADRCSARRGSASSSCGSVLRGPRPVQVGQATVVPAASLKVSKDRADWI